MALPRGRPAILEKTYEVVRLVAESGASVGIFRSGRRPYASRSAERAASSAIAMAEALAADGHTVQVIERVTYRRRAPWYDRPEPENLVVWRSPRAPSLPVRGPRADIFPGLR